jgi:hypothetical protein
MINECIVHYNRPVQCTGPGETCFRVFALYLVRDARSSLFGAAESALVLLCVWQVTYLMRCCAVVERYTLRARVRIHERVRIQPILCFENATTPCSQKKSSNV